MMNCRLHGALIVAACSAWALPAGAQLTTSHQIPYQGRLELDGVALSGAYDFWFELYPTPTGGDCQAGPSVDCLWADELQGVEVVGGSFSVVLGSTANPLGDVIWQNAEVYLGIRVAAAGDTYTPLAGRQRILAVPTAAQATTAKNYHVTGTLRVEGGVTFDAAASVAGAVTVGQSLAVGQSLTVNGTTISSFNGEVRVNGPVRMRCPANMVRVGSWCIDAAARAAQTHGLATATCDAAFTMICPIEVLIACDHLNLNNGTETPLSCGSVTDAVGSVSLVWSAGISYDTPYSNSLFSEIAAYNGGDNTIDRFDDSSSLPFFCCAPGYFY